MSDWVCHDCGTINEDMLDHVGTNPMVYELLTIEMKRRQEIEETGKMVPYYCSRCNAERK